MNNDLKKDISIDMTWSMFALLTTSVVLWRIVKKTRYSNGKHSSSERR